MDETQRNMKTDEPSPYVQVSANGIGTPGNIFLFFFILF